MMGLLDIWIPKIDYGTSAPIFYLPVTTAAILVNTYLMDGNYLDALNMCKGFDVDKPISDDAVRTKELVKKRGVSKFDAKESAIN